ncbi:MAG: hypothetical protein D4R80_05045 [Deltaproteobacteria bacterium]|nr:MAG: hypothetical protein D4R80_05045 [Deltaproteobacteria bacterium]
MARPTTVVSSGKRLLPVLLAISLLLPLLLAGTSRAADYSVSSKTYLRYYKQEFAGGNKNTYAPLYEYLSADAANLGGTPIAFHFYGWGRVDLSDPSGGTSGKESGDIGSAYLEYLHPQGNAQMKLGRFFLTEGVAVETLDGAFFKVTTPIGIGISGYGGSPVEYSILDNTSVGDSLYGGRLFFSRSGVTEIGVSYLKDKNPFEGKDRELYGGDLWLRLFGPVELTAQASYNQATQGMASQRYALRVVPGSRFDFSGGYEAYSYKDLFQTTLHPAFAVPSIDNTDKVQTIFAVVDWEIFPGLTLELVAKNIRHDNVSTGNANRGEAGFRYAFNEKKDVFGLSAAVVTADWEENEYQEYRGFVTWSPSKLRLTLDALTQQYKKEIDGKKNAVQVVASAGYKVSSSLALSGDLTYTQSPRYEQDYAGMVRATLELGTTTGGKK